MTNDHEHPLGEEGKIREVGTNSEEGLEGETSNNSGKDHLWTTLTLVGLVLLVFNLLRLWYVWLRPDPEFLAFTGGVAELLAIASFLGLQTEPGRKLAVQLDNTFSSGNVLSNPRRRCGVAWGFTILTGLVLLVGSPWSANYYRTRGVSAFEEGRYSVAIRDFRQSISLEPGNARAHYNLANAYESLLDHEAAIKEYQLSLELDDTFWPAHNNLGHLFLIAQNNPDAALTTLHTGLKQVDSELGEAIITKNIASAYLVKGLYEAALVNLGKISSILEDLRSQGENVEIYMAEAFRLEALANQGLGEDQEARLAWQDSLGFALAVAESQACSSIGTRIPPDCIVAIKLLAEARDWLAK